MKILNTAIIHALAVTAVLSAPMELMAAEIQTQVNEIVSDVISDNSNQAGWWSPLAYHNDVVYAAFNKSWSTNVHSVQVLRHFPRGFSTEDRLINQDHSVWVHEDDIGHDQPSIAVDGDGRVHVWADHHADLDGWHYFRAKAAGESEKLEIYRNHDLNTPGHFTYPIAATAPNGDIYLIVRNQPNRWAAVADNFKGIGELHHWNNKTSTWSKVAEFADQAKAVVYPDDIVIDKDGSVHILWEWAYNHPRAERNYGSYLKYKPGNGFYTVDGKQVTTPVNVNTPNLVYQGLKAGSYFTSHGIQTAKLAVYGEENKLSITYRFYDEGVYKVHRKRWNGSWTTPEILESRATIAALGHTHNGERARVYYTLAGTTPLENRLQVIERYTTTPWQKYILNNRNIERIAVVEKDDTSDIIYGAEMCSESTQQSNSYGHCSDGNGAKLSILQVDKL